MNDSLGATGGRVIWINFGGTSGCDSIAHVARSPLPAYPILTRRFYSVLRCTEVPFDALESSSRCSRPNEVSCHTLLAIDVSVVRLICIDTIAS